MTPWLLALLVVGSIVVLAQPAQGADSVPYGVADKPWKQELGNHRVRLRVAEQADAVWAHIPWRRRDGEPEKKATLVVDAANGKQVQNVVRLDINREFGDLVFQPPTAPGDYYVYFLPYKVAGRSFPRVTYVAPQETADATWMHRNWLAEKQRPQARWRMLPAAQVLGIEAIGEFHRFGPMEVIATAEETRSLLAHHADRPFLLFPEDRRFPIRMTDDLPLRWIRRGPADVFEGQAQRDEWYAFQIGLFAARQPLEDVQVAFADLRPEGRGKAIPAAAFRCINLGGIDWVGRSFRKTVPVPKGKVQALWCGVQIPERARPGAYRSTVTVSARGVEPQQVTLRLTVSPEVAKDHGDGELWRHARLRWLDSTIGLDDDVVPPFTPLRTRGRSVRCLGREVRFGGVGLPESIRSFFPMTVDAVDAEPREILAAPMAFLAETADGSIAWSSRRATVLKKAEGVLVRQTRSAGGPLALRCKTTMEFDGYINVELTLKAAEAVAAKDLRLEIPIRRDVARYLIGMGKTGGVRPKEWRWKWDRKKHQDSLWVGDVNAGLQVKLKGPNYSWPLVNIHYHHKPLDMPDAWVNGGKGGCTVTEEGDAVVIRAFSGERAMAAGEELHFHVGLLVTPVKPLDRGHWGNRYYHRVAPPAEIAKTGANVVNIHHANPQNRYINYPFLNIDQLAPYVQECHKHGLKAKIYYTQREMTNHIVEMPAVRSLGHEVFADGPGGGYTWLQEHLGTGYIPAWHCWFGNGDVCAALVTSGLSRWHNYYLEGLAWLLRHVEIDGLYLDDVGYDRVVMQRVRKVLDRTRPGCLIDFHSWNHFNGRAGYANCANLYMELFPYIDSLWFGEGFDYNQPPDYWLVEMSGIPYGLFSEMLQGGGNKWRGMVYGMTNRLPYSGRPDHLWKVWDAFGIQDARMIGYWVPDCPVRPEHKDVLATVYQKKGKALVAVASWAKGDVETKLAIDWKALGLDPSKALLTAPAIPDFQEAATFAPADALPIPKARGWLLLLGEKAP